MKCHEDSSINKGHEPKAEAQDEMIFDREGLTPILP